MPMDTTNSWRSLRDDTAEINTNSRQHKVRGAGTQLMCSSPSSANHVRHYRQGTYRISVAVGRTLTGLLRPLAILALAVGLAY